MNLSDDLIKGAKAAAGHTGLPERTIYHFVDKGLLPCTRLGRILLFRKSQLDAALSATAR